MLTVKFKTNALIPCSGNCYIKHKLLLDFIQCKVEEKNPLAKCAPLWLCSHFYSGRKLSLDEMSSFCLVIISRWELLKKSTCTPLSSPTHPGSNTSQHPSHLYHSWLCCSHKNWQVRVSFVLLMKGRGAGTGYGLTNCVRDVREYWLMITARSVSSFFPGSQWAADFRLQSSNCVGEGCLECKRCSPSVFTNSLWSSVKNQLKNCFTRVFSKL